LGYYGARFSTKDQDNDNDVRSCAYDSKGAWWYRGGRYTDCYRSNLNGRYEHGQQHYEPVVEWRAWKGNYYSLKFTEMKIRPAY